MEEVNTSSDHSDEISVRPDQTGWPRSGEHPASGWFGWRYARAVASRTYHGHLIGTRVGADKVGELILAHEVGLRVLPFHEETELVAVHRLDCVCVRRTCETSTCSIERRREGREDAGDTPFVDVRMVYITELQPGRVCRVGE